MFASQPGWQQTGYFTSETGQKTAFSFTYNNREITFNIPADLQNDKNYTITLVKEPTTENPEGIDQNVTTTMETAIQKDSTNVQIREKDAEGTIDMKKEKVMYEATFRTSKYNTFKDKMDSFAKQKMTIKVFEIGPARYGTKFTGDEYFDEFELNGTENYTSLINTYALSNNLWFDALNDVMYNAHPINDDLVINWRDYSTLGIPPISDVKLVKTSSGQTRIEYDVQMTAYEDFNNLEWLYYNYTVDNPGYSNEDIDKLLTGYYPYIIDGPSRIGRNYIIYVCIEYSLPGMDEPCSKYNVLIRGTPIEN